MDTVIVVCGPTASGKTALGVALAKALNGEVVSADSMQVYRGMDIGTAKPTFEEMEGVPHHMLSVADPREDYSVARYVADATACIDDILRRGKRALVVGGTGLYIDHLLAGRDFAPFDPAIREELARRCETEGLDKLYAELGQVDPTRQGQLHPGDKKRILRALEVFYATGTPMSALDEASKTRPPRFKAAKIGLTFADRAHLKARIDARVDDMMARGLFREVRALLDAGVPPTATAMQAIGYKELTAAVTGGGDVAAAADEIKLRSRQYAKRQLSWFRRDVSTHWILWDEKPNFSYALHDSTNFLSEWGI